MLVSSVGMVTVIVPPLEVRVEGVTDTLLCSHVALVVDGTVVAVVAVVAVVVDVVVEDVVIMAVKLDVVDVVFVVTVILPEPQADTCIVMTINKHKHNRTAVFFIDILLDILP